MYIIWNGNKRNTFATFEEAEKEAIKRAKRNKGGCTIYTESAENGVVTLHKYKEYRKEANNESYN